MFLATGKLAIKNFAYKALLNFDRNKFPYLDESFEFAQFKNNILSYTNEMRGSEIYEYRFSATQSNPDLYSSVYAVMLLGLLGQIENLSQNDRSSWADYLLSFQYSDGLFRDQSLESELSEDCHHWGWNHLAPHMIVALDYLSVKPKYDFVKVLSLFDNQTMDEWLFGRAWKQNYLAVSNEIMNVGILLQYSRDVYGNKRAKILLDQMKHWLLNNMVDKRTGLWGTDTNRSLADISKAIKTAYHIVPLYYYDGDEVDLNVDSILRYTLETQNSVGGFSPYIISDACEDIDSLYLLSVLDHNNSSDIKLALEKFFEWVFFNQNPDGGFVFKRYQKFQYADQGKLSSNINQSNMFGTWFRVLSIAFECIASNRPHQFTFSKVPGYQYLRESA